MSINIKEVTDIKVPAEFLASSILKQLEAGKKVIWFVSGGSTVPIAIEAAKILGLHPHQNLTATLADERFGPVGHQDSNWQKLITSGFHLPQAKFISILTGEDCPTTTKNFNDILVQELRSFDYKIGLFGIGSDGHTAGILPNSNAVNSNDFAVSYKTEQFERITVTPKVIESLNEAIAYVQGEEKKSAIENLQKELPALEQPAQILKKVPLLTIFTNY